MVKDTTSDPDIPTPKVITLSVENSNRKAGVKRLIKLNKELGTKVTTGVDSSGRIIGTRRLTKYTV
jgi:hypothetical protein